MLQYVQALRDRFHLRLNENGSVFLIKDPHSFQWRPVGNTTFVSSPAALTGSYEGEKVTFASIETVHQVIFVADASRNVTIGRIEISTGGAIQVYDTPVVTLKPGEELDAKWKHHVTAILGVPGPSTINITNVLGNDTDILRLKPGHATWYIPARYKTESESYDFTLPDPLVPVRVNIDADAATSVTSVPPVNRPTPRLMGLSAIHQRMLLPPPESSSASVNGDDMPKLVPSTSRATHETMTMFDEDDIDTTIERKVQESQLDKPYK